MSIPPVVDVLVTTGRPVKREGYLRMRIGILADVHENLSHLRWAIDVLSEQRSDRLVFLGDVFELGHRLKETVDLLAEAGAIGVWGNHDFGLCGDNPKAEDRQRYGEPVLAYMGLSTSPTRDRWLPLRPRGTLAGPREDRGLVVFRGAARDPRAGGSELRSGAKPAHLYRALPSLAAGDPRGCPAMGRGSTNRPRCCPALPRGGSRCL